MNERLSSVLKHPSTLPIVVGIAAFGGGVALGYILAKRQKEETAHTFPQQLRLEFNTDELAELADIKADLARIQAKPNRVDVDDKNETEVFEVLEVETETDIFVEVIDEDTEVVETLAEKIKEAMTTEVEPSPVIAVPQVHNVFSASDQEWDYEIELASRSSEQPYVIHKDEFWEEEMNFTQSTLTYWAGDDIMSDEEETPVYNYRTLIGELKFGHGSGDPNVFYVRNERRRSEYEVIFAEGLFSREVLGLEIEENNRVQDIQHSRNRKFRTD